MLVSCKPLDSRRKQDHWSVKGRAQVKLITRQTVGLQLSSKEWEWESQVVGRNLELANRFAQTESSYHINQSKSVVHRNWGVKRSLIFPRSS